MSESYYAQSMSALLASYNSFMAQAQNTFRRKQMPSVEEYQLYLKAASTAREISGLNASNDSVRSQWEDRAVSCERKAIEIYRKLNPPAVQPAAQTAAKPAVQPSAVPFSQTVKQGAAVSNPASENDWQYVTTKSGFKTRNANDDISAERIESWYRKEKPKHSLDDVVGMEKMKEIIRRQLLDNIGWNKTDAYLKIPKLKSFLFYGPFGTGKSFFIEAVASDLMEMGFKFIQLVGADVHDSYVGVGEKVVKAAFQEAVDNAPCVLYMDEFENMCPDRADSKEGHEKRLSVAFMEAYNIITTCDKPVIFLAATNYPDRIEKAMLSRISTFVPVPLPSEEVRMNYFKKKLQGIHLGDDIDEAYMVDATDNYNFRDLDITVSQITEHIKEQAIDQFSVRDENGRIIQDESDQRVAEAIANGSVMVSRELFDDICRTFPPDKKSDILASLEAFENKK